MASSYTPLLRFTLPATGELVGTWGSTVNTGITTLVENAVAGTVTVTHSNAADYTLTTANGATDEARYAYLNITGTLTAARNVVCPTSSKFYFVKNSTTGGYAITFKTSSGTGISVANGDTEYLYCDGTNVIRALTNSAVGGTKFTVAATSVTWSGNPTHTGNHTFSGNVTIEGNTTIGNASGDTFTFYSSGFAAQNNLNISTTSSNTLTLSSASGTITLQNNTAGGIVLSTPYSSGTVDINNTTSSTITNIGPSTGTGGYVSIYGNSTNGVRINNGLSGSPFNVGSATIGFGNCTSLGFASAATLTGTLTGDFMPARTTSALTKGKVFAATAGFTCNAGTAGDYYLVYNDSASSITITNGTTTMRLAGTATTGNRTLAARGFGYIWYNSSTEVIVGGDGVT